MAARGTPKARSVDHEEHIAKVLDGKRSPSSGAAVTDAGDVRAERILAECKVKGGPSTAKVSKPLPIIIQQLEKIAQEAYEEGRDPMLALRYYSPQSILANRDGWIDVGVMLIDDIAEREAHYVGEHQPHVRTVTQTQRLGD